MDDQILIPFGVLHSISMESIDCYLFRFHVAAAVVAWRLFNACSAVVGLSKRRRRKVEKIVVFVCRCCKGRLDRLSGKEFIELRFNESWWVAVYRKRWFTHEIEWNSDTHCTIRAVSMNAAHRRISTRVERIVNCSSKCCLDDVVERMPRMIGLEWDDVWFSRLFIMHWRYECAVLIVNRHVRERRPLIRFDARVWCWDDKQLASSSIWVDYGQWFVGREENSINVFSNEKESNTGENKTILKERNLPTIDFTRSGLSISELLFPNFHTKTLASVKVNADPIAPPTTCRQNFFSYVTMFSAIASRR